MQLRRILVIAMLLVGTASAQTLEDRLKSSVAGVHYPPLAEAARAHGDVHLRLSSGVVTVLSGSPLLAGIAVESAKALGSIDAIRSSGGRRERMEGIHIGNSSAAYLSY